MTELPEPGSVGRRAMRRVLIEWDPVFEWRFEGRSRVGCWCVYTEGWVNPYARAPDAKKALKYAAQLLSRGRTTELPEPDGPPSHELEAGGVESYYYVSTVERLLQAERHQLDQIVNLLDLRGVPTEGTGNFGVEHYSPAGRVDWLVRELQAEREQYQELVEAAREFIKSVGYAEQRSWSESGEGDWFDREALEKLEHALSRLTDSPDAECPAGGEHTLAKDGDYCAECGAPRPKPEKDY